MKAIFCRTKLPAASVIALMACAAPALAQTAASSATNDTGALREIVVTAQKRSENIQTVPIAVTALDEKELGRETVKDLRDLSGRVPSLVVDSVTTSPSTASIALRGISFDDVEKSFDPAVGVAVDGVFIGTNTGQLLDSFDMASLEVLRGPQGTLFGRNTIGGVVSVTRTKPTRDFGIKGEFAYSSYNTGRGRLVVNSGEIGGILALKAYVNWDSTGGFVWNAVENRHDGRYATLTGGITALLTPSSKLSVKVTYEHTRERGETVVVPESNATDLICAYAGVPGFSPPSECNRFTASSDRGAYVTYETGPRAITNDTDALYGNIEWNVAAKLKLYSITGYQQNHENANANFDGTQTGFFESGRIQYYHQFSEELRAVSDLTDQLNVLAGGYFFESAYTLYSSTGLGAALAAPSGATIFQFTHHQSISYAGFVDAQYKLNDSFKLSAGARYSEDKKDMYTNYGQITALVQITDPAYTGTQCVAATGTFTYFGTVLPIYTPANNCNGSAKFGQFTWRGNAEYTIEPGKMVYASYSKGYRSGGLNGRATDPSSLGPYRPETVDAFEIGLKADWLDHTLRTNIALYDSLYHNKQEEILQPSPPGAANPQETVVANAASATIKGLEAEVIAQLDHDLSATGSFAYTDAHYNNFLIAQAGTGTVTDASGEQLRRAPKYQASVGLNYTHDMAPGRIDASALLRYSSHYATCIVAGDATTDPRCITKNRFNLSAQLGYTIVTGPGRELNFAVFGRNLLNVKDIMGTLPVSGLFTFSNAYEPRVFGVKMGFKY